MKLRVKRPHDLASLRARDRCASVAPSAEATDWVSCHSWLGTGELRPSRVVTFSPRSPALAALSTRLIAFGNARVRAGINRPLSPVVAPYMAPSIATLASSRVAIALEATIPA